MFLFFISELKDAVRVRHSCPLFVKCLQKMCQMQRGAGSSSDPCRRPLLQVRPTWEVGAPPCSFFNESRTGSGSCCLSVRSCFREYFTHKFRAMLGKTRLIFPGEKVRKEAADPPDCLDRKPLKQTLLELQTSQ